MFDQIKQKVSLIAELEKDLSVTFRQIGDRNWAIDGDKDVESCPFCGHKDCFRVSQVEGEESSSFYKCFSCGEAGDVITWRSKRKSISIGDAAVQLAKEHGIQTGREQSPIQQIFNLAAAYYHQGLMENLDYPMALLNGLTPLQYQEQTRGHPRASIVKNKIGFSDGKLHEYLDGIGIDLALIREAGLLNKRDKDFLPANCFIYPHFVKGKVSHFTFKDPLKRLAYQLPKKYLLNGWMFYGQDTFDKSDVVTLVEGENDYLSVMESGCSPATLAFIGQVSADQLNWLRENGKGKKFISLCDPDDGGQKYRVALEKNRRFFGGLLHVLPPDGKDIDDHLRDGADYATLVRNNLVEVKLEAAEKMSGAMSLDWSSLTQPDSTPSTPLPPASASPSPSTPPVSAPAAPVATQVLPSPFGALKPLVDPFQTGYYDDEPDSAPSAPAPAPKPAEAKKEYTPPAELSAPPAPAPAPKSSPEPETDPGEEETFLDDSPIYQAKGCYWKTRFDKNGEPKPQRLSDFTLVLRNVYIKEGMDDEDRHREVVVRRQDGFLSDPFIVDSETKVGSKLFKIIVAKKADCEWLGMDSDLVGVWRLAYSKAPDRTIRIPRQAGRYPKLNSWIFKNTLITGSGVAVPADDAGVFWVQGRHLGVKPGGLSPQGGDSDADGVPRLDTSLSEAETRELLRDTIHHLSLNLGSPGAALMALGWIQSNVHSDLLFKVNNGMGIFMFWGSNGDGKSTIAKWLLNIFGMTEYGCTNMTLLKSGVGFLRKAEYYGSLPMFIDEVRSDEASLSNMGLIRAWYDRDGRSIAARDGFGVINQKIRSNLLLAGEDLPPDPATKERLIIIRVYKNGRETLVTYKWFQDHVHLLSNIGYRWIIESCNVDETELINGIKKIDQALAAAGCSNRISKNWSAAGYFGNKLAQEFMPEFDFMDFLAKEGVKEHTQQKSESTLLKFFESVEALQAQDHSRVTNAHIGVEGGVLHLWFAALFKAVGDDNRGKDSWSKMAILRALKEEAYFIRDDLKVQLGFNGVRRTVISLDLSKAPEVFKNIAAYAEGFGNSSKST